MKKSSMKGGSPETGAAMKGGSPGASAAIEEGSPETGTLPWSDVKMGLGAVRGMPDERDGSAEAGATMGGGSPPP